MLAKSELNVYLLIALAFAAILQYDDRIAFYETEWFQRNWTISLPIALLYLLVVATGRPLATRLISPCLYRQLLKYWNFGLAVFSILGVYRVGTEFMATLRNEGLEATFCRNHYFHSRSVYFWYFLFVTSKAAEMGDTLLLLAGNKPVRFIHWFHHAITMIYAFYIAVYLPAIGRWMSTMNFTVHSIMYSYYLLMAHRVKVSRTISMAITSLQILQMFAGLAVTVAAFASKNWLHHPCDNGGYTVEVAILIYTLYVFLFVNFFCKSYLTTKVKQ